MKIPLHQYVAKAAGMLAKSNNSGATVDKVVLLPTGEHRVYFNFPVPNGQYKTILTTRAMHYLSASLYSPTNEHAIIAYNMLSKVQHMEYLISKGKSL